MIDLVSWPGYPHYLLRSRPAALGQLKTFKLTHYPHEPQLIIASLLLYQDQNRFDVAISMVAPIADERVIAATTRKR